MQSEHREPEALVNMRTHLTVLTLALAHLRRRHGEDADIGRLCRLADAATRQLKGDIADVEAMLLRAESREASRMPPIRPHQSVTADARSQDTGPLGLPPTARHGQTS